MTEHPDLSQANFAGAVICYAKCYPCQFGCHFEPPEPHTWGDADDFEHAKTTGQNEPGNCACYCAKSSDVEIDTPD